MMLYDEMLYESRTLLAKHDRALGSIPAAPHAEGGSMCLEVGASGSGAYLDVVCIEYLKLACTA